MKKQNILSYLFCLFIFILTLVPTGTRILNIPVSSDIILAGIIFIYVIFVIIDKDYRNNFKKSIFDFFQSILGILLTIVIGIMTISVLYSLEKNLALSETIRFITYIIMFFIFKYNINIEGNIKRILNTVLICTVVLSIFGIYQYFTGVGLSNDFIEQYSFGAKARIATTFGNPNSYAPFLLFFIFPTIILFMESKEIVQRALYGIISILMLVNIILTFSRNAWLGFALGLGLLVIYYSWKLLIAFGFLGLSTLLIPTIRNRVANFGDASQNASRIKHWKTAMLMIKDHPILGVGNGNYVSYYDSYIEKHPELDFAHMKRFPTHNSYLKLTSELGIVGIIPFLMLIVVSILRIKKSIPYINDKYINSFIKGFFVAAIAFLFMNFFDNLFFVPKVTTWFWLLLALSEGYIYRDGKIYKGIFS